MKSMRRILAFLGLIILVMLLAGAYVLFGPAVKNKEVVSLRVHSHWSVERLVAELGEKVDLKYPVIAKYVMIRMGYKNVKPCKITIPDGASLFRIVRILQNNRYQTVNITINGSTSKEKLAQMLATNLEIQRDSFLRALGSSNIYGTGFDSSNWASLFIPDTYNFAVATELPAFFARMKKEYDVFWNEERTARADGLALTPDEVSIIASIVTKESNKTDEYIKIAGVYINRLKKGMLLQADPTAAFARGYDGPLYRSDLMRNSPYNTYVNPGLPPGPICIPNKASILAVLAYGGHSYLYFVADPALNGYHHFSATLSEHNIWVQKYRVAIRIRNSSGN